MATKKKTTRAANVSVAKWRSGTPVPRSRSYTRQDLVDFLAKRARDCDEQAKDLRKKLRREGAKPHDLYAMEAACTFQKATLFSLADEVANGCSIV